MYVLYALTLIDQLTAACGDDQDEND